ncbi:MAG TPA: hypothetical protein VJJ83_00790, partial [Candidatus Babeliales bacterium]|nr:hypothetical protein [Candidatus Babeliales bacterium]
LFATHYHELTRLAAQYPGIVNYYAQSHTTAQGLVLLHQIVPGVAQSSFGIEVAKLAQLPNAVIMRAQTILAELEQRRESGSAVAPIKSSCASFRTPAAALQLAETNVTSTSGAATQIIPARQLALLAQLEKLDYEQLSPRQAFDLLWQFKPE